MSTKIILTMPQPGETITEGTIVKWLSKVGDIISEGDFVVELETEKALFEYESPYEGELIEILAPEGAAIPVGDPIALFEVDDKKAANYFMLGMGSKENTSVKNKIPKNKEKEKEEKKVDREKGQTLAQERKLSPLVRRLVREHGISLEDLNAIEGTGPQGRITKENITSFLQKISRGQPKESGEDNDLVPCSPVRMRIAEHMVRSKETIPHAHTNVSVDVTKIIEYRRQQKDDFLKREGISLSITPLVFPALKKAIEACPLVNASFVADKKSIRMHQKINLGVAVGTEKGLFIPVIHHLEGKSFLAAAHDMAALVERAQQSKLTVHDLTGMTFTFNNFGFYGTSIGVQIILPPQSATLGMGLIEKRPWVVNDEICIRYIAEMTLAFDHRVMDGRDAGLFLSTLKDSIENFSHKDL